MHRLKIPAEYFQFVVMDAESRDDFSTLWTQDALERMLALGVSAACPGTLRNEEVQVEIVVSASAPILDLSGWDHAVEGSMTIPSGKLVVMNCKGHVPDGGKLRVKPGTYQLLSLARGIDSIRVEWEPADDIYRVYLWPGVARPTQCLKRWQRAHG